MHVYVNGSHKGWIWGVIYLVSSVCIQSHQYVTQAHVSRPHAWLRATNERVGLTNSAAKRRNSVCSQPKTPYIPGAAEIDAPQPGLHTSFYIALHTGAARG